MWGLSFFGPKAGDYLSILEFLKFVKNVSVLIRRGILCIADKAYLVFDICTSLWNNLYRDLSSFRHGSINTIGVQERTGERKFVNGNGNLYQPPTEHDETASSVSEGNLCFSL